MYLCSLILKGSYFSASAQYWRSSVLLGTAKILVGGNLAALVAWPFILLSNIESEKLERNQVSSSQQR